jgi:hypothetical protein
MASQTSSSFSTEGTQYAKDNSYYLLDSAPGAGISIVAPVTIAGAPGTPGLIVQGTTTLAQTGALSLNTNTITAGPAAATYAASGNLAISSAGNASLSGALLNTVSSATTALTLAPASANLGCQGNNIGLTAFGTSIVSSGPVTMSSATGSNINITAPGTTADIAVSAGDSVTVNAVAGTLSMQGLGNTNLTSLGGTLSLLGAGNTNVQSSTGALSLQGFTTASISSQGQIVATFNDAATALNGFGVEVYGTTRLRNGFASVTGMGTFAAPASATPVGPGHSFQMTGNKAFITTGGATATLIVAFFAAGQNFIAQVGQIGATGTNVGSIIQNGDTVIIGPANPLNPIVVSILAL